MFRASGHTVAFPGFTAVYEEGNGRREKVGFRSGAAAALRSGDKPTGREDRAVPALTQPPARYTEASLIRAMGGNAASDNRPPMRRLLTIIDRDYVTKENSAPCPTPLGEGVTGLLG